LQLDDGTALTIRSLIPQDRAQMGEFFERVPEEDRTFLKEDLLSREEVSFMRFVLQKPAKRPHLARRRRQYSDSRSSASHRSRPFAVSRDGSDSSSKRRSTLGAGV
jgi:hypothetical protein